MEKIITKTMNKEEQEKALELLNIAIHDGIIKAYYGDEIIYKAKQGCYISSSDYEGIYFPNEALYLNGNKIICISKIYDNEGIYEAYKDVFSVIYEYDLGKNENMVVWQPLEEICYTKEELLFYQRQKQKLIKIEKENKLLKSIQKVTTIKGEPFKIFSKNFTGAHVILNEDYISIDYNDYFLKNYNKDNITVEEVYAFIQNKIEENKNKIELLKQATEAHSIFLKIEKLILEIKEKITDLEEKKLGLNRSIIIDIVKKELY